MKLADLIYKLQKLAKENNLEASHDVQVYDDNHDEYYDFDVKVNCGDLEIEICISDYIR